MSNARVVRDEEALAQLLKDMKTIAVLGMKDKIGEAAYEIPKLLHEMGFNIIPVNPNYHNALGKTFYASLQEINESFDCLNVFRRSSAIPAVVDEVLALKHVPRVVWLQTGIEHAEAAQRLVEKGVNVVMDRCLGVYAKRYTTQPKH